jgi:hypothetical protein
MTESTDCLDCISGIAIADSDFMGACFRACPTCQPVCPCCNGQGRYPSWTRDMAEFAVSYNETGLLPVLCHTCGGVVGVSLLDPETGP